MSLTRAKAGMITYKNDGTGAVVRTIKDKLGETVSVKDFGAVGDGVTDDTAAIQAADAVGTFKLPSGTYRIASNITISNDMVFELGSVLLVDTGITVTLAGLVVAEPSRVIFAGDGDCTFATANTDNRVYANWYAANGSSTIPNTDFAARWNEMWANANLSLWVGMVGSQTVKQSMNCSGWNNADIGVRTVKGDGAVIYVEHNDDCVMDTSDTSRAIFSNFTIKGISSATADTPKVCLLRARDVDERGIGPCYFEHMDLTGYYSVATLLCASAERQTFKKCIFANTYEDSGSRGRPARLITAETTNNLGVTSNFRTLSAASILSGNGQHYIDCSAQNKSTVVGSFPVAGGNARATTIIKYDGGHIFENDYQRSSEWASYLLDCSGADVHKVSFINNWIEPYDAVNQYYTVMAIGDGTAASTVSDLCVDMFSDSPQTSSLYIKDVGRIWGLDFKGPFRSENYTTHGAVIESSGPVDMHSAVMKLGFAGSIDLSGINDANSDLSFTAYLKNEADYIPPTLGTVDADVYTNDGVRRFSTPKNYIASLTCSASGTVTLKGTADRLSYTETGGMVFVTGGLTVDSVSSPTGYLNLSLPIDIDTASDDSAFCSGGITVTGAVAANVSDFIMYGSEATPSNIRIYLGDAPTRQEDSAQEMQANTTLLFSFFYRAAY